MQRLALVGLALLFIGALLAHKVQTGSGNIVIEDHRWQTSTGHTLSALVYTPASASVDTPAPAILAVHGYINSRETQSAFAIEFARRGFVVLALDQAGHGYSTSPAFENGFGGPDALLYLSQLPTVDPARIGLEGHSMGGWTVLMAAAAHPELYQAMVLAGSSTGTFGAPEGTPTFPRNLMLIFSLYDEFSEFMWGAPVPADIVHTDKLKLLFGTDKTVEVGKVYGDKDQFTARTLTMPAVTHPGDHHSRVAVGHALEWFQDILNPPAPLPHSDQVWYFKSLGTLMMLVGLSCLVLPLCAGLLQLKLLRAAVSQPVQDASAAPGWTIAMVASTLFIPVVLFFPLQTIANLALPASPMLPQQITNGVLLWAWGSGAVSLIILALSLRGHNAALSQLGLTMNVKTIATAGLLALAVFSILYLAVFTAQKLLTLDFRFWVVALKSMSAEQGWTMVVYFPLFAVFFLALSASMHLAGKRQITVRRDAIQNALMLSSGFVVLLVVQYLPLLLGGTLLIPDQPLLTIVAFQFVPLLAFVAVISTWCFHRTQNIFTGAFLNSFLVTWYMVAGTATQSVPFMG